MGLCDTNRGFEKKLEGWTTAGPVFAETSYLGRRRTFQAAEGNLFARLDGLRPLTANDLRDLSSIPPENIPVDTSYIALTNSDGTVTHGVDGAYIECANIAIPVGHSLHFQYNFIAGDEVNKNDFAVLEFYPDDATDSPPSLRVLIHDTRLLAAANRAQTGWELSLPVQFPQEFIGTVRWVVSNGRSLNMSLQQGQAKPSCLLLDDIRILGS